MTTTDSKNQTSIAEPKIAAVGLTPDSLLESLDRELGFYRKRAGQVFFFGLLAEVLILAGKERILLGNRWPILHPLIYSLMFLMVAYFGRRFGMEYRDRIHALKHSRHELLKNLGYEIDYPRGRPRSEIKSINFILGFLSIIGIVLVWLAYFGRAYEGVPK